MGRAQTINEMMVLTELKTFFPGGHIARPEEERDDLPESRRPVGR